MDLCKYLKTHNTKIVILTRGYKSGLEANDSVTLLNENIIQQPQSNNHFYADEARMQSAKLKDVFVVIGRDRRNAAKRFVEEFGAPDYWILEDGFQHFKVKRDFDLVLLDDKFPLSKRAFCLPSGRLREGVNALRRADHILLTRDQKTKNRKLKSTLERWDISFNSVAFSMLRPCAILDQKPLSQNDDFSVVLGIAKPDHILSQLVKWEMTPIKSIILADHGEIPQEKVMNEIQAGRKIVTTEKDFYRHRDFFSTVETSVYIIYLETNFEPELLRFG